MIVAYIMKFLLGAALGALLILAYLFIPLWLSRLHLWNTQKRLAHLTQSDEVFETEMAQLERFSEVTQELNKQLANTTTVRKQLRAEFEQWWTLNGEGLLEQAFGENAQFTLTDEDYTNKTRSLKEGMGLLAEWIGLHSYLGDTYVVYAEQVRGVDNPHYIDMSQRSEEILQNLRKSQPVVDQLKLMLQAMGFDVVEFEAHFSTLL